MTAYVSTHDRRFTRDADRRLVAGVCAGIADYFGFRLLAVRAIFVIALFVAFPFAALAYIAMVLLVPSESRYDVVVEREIRCRRRRLSRRERRRAEAEARERERDRRTEQVRERYRSLDERLARIEKYVTSSRYDLDREFRNL